MKKLTIADALKATNARISDGDTWMVWEDAKLGSWQIWQKKRNGRGVAKVAEFLDDEEDEAAREFLRLAGYEVAESEAK